MLIMSLSETSLWKAHFYVMNNTMPIVITNQFLYKSIERSNSLSTMGQAFSIAKLLFSERYSGNFMTFIVLVLTVHLLLSFPLSIPMNQKMDSSVHSRKRAKPPGNCSLGPICPLASPSFWTISAADSWGGLGWDISRPSSSSATSAQIVSRSRGTLTERHWNLQKPTVLQLS